MATYYFRNSGNVNWGTATNWSLSDGGPADGAVPTATDDVVFSNNSGNCTINASARTCRTITFNGGTGYTGTITFTFGLSIASTVSGANAIVLSSGMTFAGAATFSLTSNANCTLTSNGKEVSVPFSFAYISSGANHTITFSDNWTFGENVNLHSNSGGPINVTFQNNTLFCKKNCSLTCAGNRGVSGTTNIELNGTGTLSSNGRFGLNININTTGSITIGNFLWGFGSGLIFKYTTGTVAVTSGTTFTLFNTSATTNVLDLNGINFETFTVTTSNHTITLNSNFTCRLLSLGSPDLTINNNTFFVTSLTSIGSAVLSGTATLTFNGWGGDGTFASASHGINTVINAGNTTLTIGNLTITNSVSLTHLSGAILHTGQISNSTCTLSFLPSALLNSIRQAANSLTLTLASNVNVRSFTCTDVNTTLNGSGFALKVDESLTLGNSSSIFSGTGKIAFVGTGTIDISNTSGYISVEFEIDTNGTAVLTGTAEFRGTFRHTKGYLNAKGSTVRFTNGASIINASKSNFDNVQIVSGATVTMNEFFSGVPQLLTKVNPTSTTNYTIAFQDGFEKIAKFVDVVQCTISNPGQLLVLTKGCAVDNNIGIRYYNQSPNGSSHRTVFIDDNLVSSQATNVGYLVGDSAFC